MKRWALVTGCAALAALLFASVSLNAASGDKPRRVAKAGDIMAGIHKVHCGALKKALDAGPESDKDWKTVGVHAAMMNEAGHILMQDGRCPDAVWAKACATLRDGSDKVSAAIESKNLAEAKAGFGAMVASCKACHSKHRKKK